jgi:formate/nitrite transporter FocA (FNT family)
LSAPEPHEIYERVEEEGRRRLQRPLLELMSTSLVAGFDVVFGLTAFALASAALEKRFGADVGHLAGSLAFAIAFVFIVVGRSELFTENFLVPIAGLDRRDRVSWFKLAELWTVSPILNVLGGTLLIIVLTVHGVLPHGAGSPLIATADKLHANNFLGAFLSAVGAGALITLMTWLVEGSESMGIRVLMAWISGAVLTLAVFNHVIVATLELVFAIRYGSHIPYVFVVGNFFVAVLGNMIGGILFVTLTRTGQAKSSGAGS